MSLQRIFSWQAVAEGNLNYRVLSVGRLIPLVLQTMTSEFIICPELSGFRQ